MHHAILLFFIKLPFVIKIIVLSIFEWLFYTGFTVHLQIRIDFFVISPPNICCVYSKELSQWGNSFEIPNCMLKLMGKKENIHNYMLIML